MEKGGVTVPGGDKRQKNIEVERILLKHTHTEITIATYSPPVLTVLTRQG